MEIFSEINNKHKGLALALGFFDGVHKGHKAVIKSAVDFARVNERKSAVITFKEHPQVLLRGCAPEYITTEAERREKLDALGVDFCFEIDFNSVLQLSGEDYIKKVLVDNFSPISVSTGFNHFFGAQKSGTVELLEAQSNKYGFEYFKIPPVMFGNDVVSSSLIRKELCNGNIEKVNECLGEKFSICSKVVKGASLASKIGFKTANFNYPQGLVKLPFGVYEVSVDGMKAIANLGVKPTFENLTSEPVLEAHILNFEGDLYGKNMRVEFERFLRAEKKFASVDELVSQIKKDISSVRV